jgi:hypothetical protein
VLEPVIARYRERGIELYFRADAAFAKPEIYARIRRMARQFDVALRQIICNNQDVSLSWMEQSWRTRWVKRSRAL